MKCCKYCLSQPREREREFVWEKREIESQGY
uniref:Uncharacterized protein n=1 Tax=Anguilla anguilla TaxID=7936 RepID=A0A0E9UQ78_ANGAN